MKQKLMNLLSEEEKDGPPRIINSVTIDFYLWNYAKLHGNKMAHCPIHRTQTVFY